MVKIIPIANAKGGVGKTTVSVNLASTLAARKKKVLLIDFDPQGNSSQHSAILDENGHSFLSALVSPTFEKIDGLVVESEYGFDLIPAGRSLALAHDELKKKRTGRKPALYLRGFIDNLINFYLDPWDYIIVDTPPTPSLLTVNALACADYVLVPVEPAYFSLAGIATICESIEGVKEYNPGIRYGIIPTRFIGDKGSREVLDQIKEAFPEDTFTPISHSVDLKDAPRYLQPINFYKSKSKAVTQFKTLVKELEERI